MSAKKLALLMILVVFVVALYSYNTSKEPSPKNITTNVYLYSSALDTDKDGNIMCSANGLVSATRTIPLTSTPLTDTLMLFIQGAITNEEKTRGLTTEYPLNGLSFKTISLADNGVLTLTLEDPYNKSSGGACRSSILRAQLEATAKQFKEVTSVVIKPDTLFQP